MNKMVDGKSPLHFAVQGGHVSALEALLQFQPDVDVTVSIINILQIIVIFRRKFSGV